MQAAYPPIVAACFLLLGLAMGAVLQRTHFCTMGCVSDAVLFGSLRRLRVWALALAVALVGSQTVAVAGWVDLAASPYPRGGWQLAAALPGGVLFGLGMVQAGGCISRNLVRFGGGSLKAATALLAVLVGAAGTTALLPGAAPAARLATPGAPLLALALAIALLGFSLRPNAMRGSPWDLITGLVLGGLVTVGWLGTALAGVRPDSINYLAFGRPDIVLPLAGGTIVGALLTARARGEFRIERFTVAGDLRRHVVGGVLMGIGGSLAFGCTIGQGLTGASTVSPASLLALSGMLLGGWWGVKQLETGRLLPWPNRGALRQQ